MQTRLEQFAATNGAALSPVTKYCLYNTASFVIDSEATNYPELMQFSPLNNKGLTFNKGRGCKVKELMNILIEDNVQLTSLLCGGSVIDDEAATLLCNFIKSTSSLKVLDIHYSRVKDIGMMALIEALKINSSLTHINIRSNALTPVIFNSLMELFDKYNFSVRSICIVQRTSCPMDWKPTVEEEKSLHDLIIRNALLEKKTARSVVCGIINEPSILAPSDIKLMLAKYSMFAQFPRMDEQRVDELLKNAADDYLTKFRTI